MQDRYTWELELADGTRVTQAAGQRWQDVDPAAVLRAGLVPTAGGPRVDVFCSPVNRFVGRFGKGFLRQANGFQLGEYAHCIETTTQRVWVLSGGHVLVTPPEHNLRV